MTEIGNLITKIINQILYTFQIWNNIELLGTTLLKIMIGFVICNALITLMIVVNRKGKDIR